MNNWIAKNIYRVLQSFRKEKVYDNLNYLEKTQWDTKEELEDIQLKKLKKLLITSYENTRFYKRRFDSCKFDPYKFNSLNELNKIPFLTKSQLRQNYADLINNSITGSFETDTTSGSTGEPIYLLKDRSFSAFNRATMYRQHKWYGIDIGDKEARFWGSPLDQFLFSKEKLKDLLMNRKRFSVFNINDRNMINYWKIIKKFKPQYIYGYSSGIYCFSNFIKCLELIQIDVKFRRT